MKANVVYWYEPVEEGFMVWAYNSYYEVDKAIKLYKTKKAAEAYVTKVNARLQGKAARTK